MLLNSPNCRTKANKHLLCYNVRGQIGFCLFFFQTGSLKSGHSSHDLILLVNYKPIRTGGKDTPAQTTLNLTYFHQLTLPKRP